eukprot:s3923_g6.t1
MYCHARPRQEPVESVSLGVVCFKNRRTATKTGNVDLSIEHAVAMTKAKGNACSVFVRPGGQGSNCHAAMHAQVQMCDIALSVDPTAPKASGWRPCGLFLLFGAAALARATRQIAAHEASFYEDQIMKAAAAGNPAVQFDNGWFMKHCDLSEFQEDQASCASILWHQSGSRVRGTNPTLDAARWKLGTKCAENGDGREPEIHQDITTDGDCAKTWPSCTSSLILLHVVDGDKQDYRE